MGEKKEKKKGKSIATKTLIYLIISAAIAAVLIMFSYGKIQFRTLSDESYSLIESFEETYKFMKDKEADTSAQVENDICVSARLTASAVRTGGDDIRPCRYHNGWIIKKNSNVIEFPDDYSADITLEASDIPEEYSTNVKDGTEVSCAWIRGNYYYVEFKAASEEEEIIDEGVNYQKAIDNYAAATGYNYLSFASEQDGDYSVTAATEKFAAYGSASELGLSGFLSSLSSAGSSGGETASGENADSGADRVSAKRIRIKGKNYIVFGTKTFDIKYVPDEAAVMLVPMSSILIRALVFTLILIFLMMILCVPMGVWLISIFRRYSCGYFSDEQLKAYSYEIIKKKVVIIIALCTVAAYGGSFFVMSLDSIFEQTSRADSTLKEYFKRIDDDEERTGIQWEGSQERYIENAKRLAVIIDNRRALQNEKWLSEASGIIDADYIMLFDENGDEIISDSQYRRISLKNRSNPDMADFSRLLNGVESISHAGVNDEITGLTRDYHGICLKYLTKGDTYGALLIAVDPNEHSWVRFNNEDYVAATMAPENGFIIGINPETGAVASSSSKALSDKKLKRSERDDSFLGVITIDRMPYYAVSAAHGNKYYYYGIDEKYMMSYVLGFSLCYALMVFIIISLMCRNLLRRSPYKTDEEEIINSYTRKKLDRLSTFVQKATEKNNGLLSFNNEKVSADKVNVKMTKDYYYRAVTPEREALSAFEMLLSVFTLCIGIAVLIGNKAPGSTHTVIDYLFVGKWTHGFNLFSFAMIFFLFCILVVIIAALKAISAVLDSVLSKRGRTISSLTMNIMLYVVIIAFIFISLGCLGVNAKALFASAGLVGLAVSMGFKDIISDILAGIMIITGRTFEVGDYIEIRDASSGTVKRMGLRKTELISDNGKSFYIRNSQISKVTNHSRSAGKPAAK